MPQCKSHTTMIILYLFMPQSLSMQTKLIFRSNRQIFTTYRFGFNPARVSAYIGFRFTCTGNETSLSDCTSSASNQCVADNVNYVVAIQCGGDGLQTEDGIDRSCNTCQTITDDAQTNASIMLQNQCGVTFIIVALLLSLINKQL
jgi:hypothetical protein